MALRLDVLDEPLDLGRTLVDEVTWYMRERRVPRAALAESMGVTPGRVSQILSGDEALTLRTLASLIDALGARVQVTLRPAG